MSSLPLLYYHMSTHVYHYTLKDLLAAFREAGYPVSHMWIYRQEQKGNLILPRSTTNFKKAQGRRTLGFLRIFTKTQIEAIVKAFLPGGNGYYNYRKERI